MEFDQLRVEQLEQKVIGALAIDHGNFEPFVMQTLLQAGFGGHLGDLIVFVGCLFNLVHGWMVAAVAIGQRCGNYLGDADSFCPVDALLLVLSKLTHGEMRTLRFEAVIRQNFVHLFGICQRGELGPVAQGGT